MSRTGRMIALIAATLLGSASAASAQIAVDKLEMELRVDGTGERTGVLRVRNEGATPAQATIKIEDWDRSEDGTNRFYPAGSRNGSCGERLSVFPLALSLQPGESQAIRVDLSGSIDKECTSLVVVETPTARPAAGGRTLIYNIRTALKVYATRSGLSRDGEVTDLAVEPDSAGATTLGSIAFTNRGDVHVTAKARLEIRRDDNSVIDVVSMPTMYALPGATMRSKAALPKLPAGKYILLATVDFGGQDVAAGLLEHVVR